MNATSAIVRQGSAVLPPVAVYIVDDDAAMRAEMAEMLGWWGLAVTEFATGNELLDAADRLRPGIVILDLHMPGRDGLDIQRALNTRGTSHQVIILTGQGRVATVVQTMQNGAVDYLEKPVMPDVMKAAVAVAVKRLDVRLAETVRADLGCRMLDRLTPRERDVLRGIVAGKANKIIALKHGLSFRTIESYRHSLMTKLGTKSVAGLVRIVQAAEMHMGKLAWQTTMAGEGRNDEKPDAGR